MLDCDRTICSVFIEMRTCLKTRNFSYLRGLIEEGQSYGNRMEAALERIDTDWEEERIEGLKRIKRELKKEITKLQKEKGGLTNG